MSSEARERAVKTCVAATKQIMDHKLAQPFLLPVDYVTLGIPQVCPHRASLSSRFSLSIRFHGSRSTILTLDHTSL